MKTTTAYWPIAIPSTNALNRLNAKLRRGFSQLWQGLQSRLDVSDEPKVWPSQHRTIAPPTWNGYDPVTGQSIYEVSEVELRTWLEELHYRDQQVAYERQQQLRLLWNA
ncbi:MAG: hypothetical protein HC929_12015 [Leptolyngbyaceae cyanobacterium SM2_5_2]|nr:hypothetical protein [Leptolyngbyaceae cyanobacterium SM2_5_2]